MKYLTASNSWESGPQGLTRGHQQFYTSLATVILRKQISNSKKPEVQSAGSEPTGKRKAVFLTVPVSSSCLCTANRELAAIFQLIFLTSILPASCTVHCCHSQCLWTTPLMVCTGDPLPPTLLWDLTLYPSFTPTEVLIPSALLLQAPSDRLISTPHELSPQIPVNDHNLGSPFFISICVQQQTVHLHSAQMDSCSPPAQVCRCWGKHSFVSSESEEGSPYIPMYYCCRPTLSSPYTERQ